MENETEVYLLRLHNFQQPVDLQSSGRADLIIMCLQITWRDIAGLDEVITELKETVILPVQKRHLFQGSRLLQPPKGQRHL